MQVPVGGVRFRDDAFEHLGTAIYEGDHVEECTVDEGRIQDDGEGPQSEPAALPFPVSRGC